MKPRNVACVLLLLPSLVACSSSSSTKKQPAEASAPLAPTFTNVYKVVIKGNGCTAGQCHGGAEEGGLGMITQASAYTSLVGVKAQGPCPEGGAGGDAGASTSAFPGIPGIAPVCGCGWTGKIRVVAGDPDSSLLVQKLDPNPPCGDRMPQAGDPIPADQLALVRNWIQLGAQND